MSYGITWTPRALLSFEENLEYLGKEWTLAVTNEFLDEVEHVLQIIEGNPFLYSIHNKTKKIHKCNINKRISLYYRIDNKSTISLITFWNTTQDPAKLKL